MAKTYGAIDVGSNSLRLLIARRDDDGEWATLHTEARITRLSGKFDPGRALLHPDSIGRTIAVLKDYAALLDQHGVTSMRVATTGISRKADNAEEFLERIRTDTGLTAEVISGEVEAGLALDGARFRLGEGTGAFVFIDIGGSSTELSVCAGETRRLQSLNLGAVELTERLIAHDPPGDEDLSAVFKQCHYTLRSGYDTLGGSGAVPGLLVGTAGTITTVVAMRLGMTEYDPERVEGYRLRIGEVADQLATLVRLTTDERKAIAGLPAGRADVIVSGMAILLTAMELGGYREMTVTEGSLLEGLLLDAASREG